MDKTIELKPIKETTSDFEALERRLRDFLKRMLFLPLLREADISHDVLMNAKNGLYDLLRSGQITFYRGTFSGKFSAESSKALKAFGAKWDRKEGTFKFPMKDLPSDLKQVIGASESKFKEKMAKIDKKLAQILPEEIADELHCSDIFDRSLWKTEREFQASVRKISVGSELTLHQRRKIASEWQNNMRIWIKDFTEKEIVSLRKEVQKAVFTGDRYGSLIDSIQKSYQVTANKAKFLARQETALLMAKFKETRYSDAGVKEYKWNAVSGSKLHPVRPRHKALADASKKGKIYRWDDPPNTAEPDQAPRYNNPGQDFNCRCYATPIVRFRG